MVTIPKQKNENKEKETHPGNKQALRVIFTFIIVFISMFIYALIYNKQI